MKRAKPDHVKKLIELFEQYPDGLNMKQVLTELQTSVVNAEAALNELGAVKQGAKWVLPDDEVAPVEVAPSAKADTAVVNENFTTELGSSPSELPITEETPCEQTCTAHICGVDQKCFFEKPQLVGNPDQLPTPTENPVDPCPMPCIDQPEDVLPEGKPEGKCPVCKVATDVAPLGLDGECQDCYEDATDKAWWDVVSDYSLIFENIMARVLSTIKKHGGATADRLRELTGMHPDDIEDAVQFMVDHKQLVGRPLYFTTVYEVVA